MLLCPVIHVRSRLPPWLRKFLLADINLCLSIILQLQELRTPFLVTMLALLYNFSELLDLFLIGLGGLLDGAGDGFDFRFV